MPSGNSYTLIPMTSFVIEYYSNEGYADLQTLKTMINYAQFLKKQLTLEMFVPVNRDGNVLKMPHHLKSKSLYDDGDVKSDDVHDDIKSSDEEKIYNKAQEKCFFKGFEVAYNGYSVIRILASYDHSIELSFNKIDSTFQSLTDIESLAGAGFEIYLSRTALKAIGIKSRS